jgi:hypothetical protein
MDQPVEENSSVKDLYPSLSSEQLLIAQENIDRYLQLVLRIAGRNDGPDDPH